MPISPENAKRYPADWKTVVVPRIRERSGDRCECTGQCGIDHGGRCKAINRRNNPATHSIVVLTVMHLDHTPENCCDENLLHACQRCHLRYDADHHRLNSEATRRKKKNNLELFDEHDRENRQHAARHRDRAIPARRAPEK
jgi:hypothetical protein